MGKKTWWGVDPKNRIYTDFRGILMITLLPPVGWITYAVLGMAGWLTYLGIDESRAEYTTKQDTVWVIGVNNNPDRKMKSCEYYQGCVKGYTHNNIVISGVNTNGQKQYNGFHTRDCNDAAFIESGDSIVVKSTYRNGVQCKDSLIVNLTKQKMIQNAIQNKVR